MFIEKLALLNVRNYQSLILELDSKVNTFIGDNAQGKTNILEAIFFSGTVRSHRASRDVDMLKWNENYFVIKVWGENQQGKFLLEIGLNKEGRKKYKLNGVEKKKTEEIIGTVKVVLFSPEDLSLVKGSPVVRRKFLDNEIIQISPSYYHNLINYNKAVSHRNSLLKEIRVRKGSSENLAVWDQQLVLFGAKIIYKKLEILKKLIPLARLMHRKITNGAEELEIKYISNVLDREGVSVQEIEEMFLDKLMGGRSQEIERGVTLFGPHRDDLGFFINNKEIKFYGSQGQQRTASLSVKLAELELIKGESGEYPVLLLDDVMSELDEDRRTHLLDTVKARIQTFITATDLNFIDKERKEEGMVFSVKMGTVNRWEV